MSMIYKECN